MSDHDDIDWEAVFENNPFDDEAGPKKSKVSRPSRQFPGPAGLMPRIQVDSTSAPKLAKILALKNKEEEVKKPSTTCPPLSQTLSREELIEDNPAWQKMLENEAVAAEGLLERFSISSIHGKTSPSTSTKTPMLVAVVKSLDMASGLDPTCELQDHSGCVSAMIHRDVVDEHGDHLRIGTVLVLHNVAIIVSRLVPYVNITRNNLSAVYSGDGTANIIAKLSPEDVLRTSEKCQRENLIVKNVATPPPTQPRPRFQPPSSSFVRPAMLRTMSPIIPRHHQSLNMTSTAINVGQEVDFLQGVDEDALFGDF